jgi:hypothetical protein
MINYYLIKKLDFKGFFAKNYFCQLEKFTIILFIDPAIIGVLKFVYKFEILIDF